VELTVEARRALHDRGLTAEVGDLILEGGERRPQVQRESFRIVNGPIDPHFNAPVGDLADVPELDTGKPSRGNDRHADQRIVGRLAIDREFERDQVVHQAGIEAQLDLGADLGLQIRVADVLGSEHRCTLWPHGRRVGLDRVEHVRLLPACPHAALSFSVLTPGTMS